MNEYSWIITVIFVIGYFLITIEHLTKINKTAIALLMAVFCWVVYFQDPSISYEKDHYNFMHHLGDVSQIIFFLMGALTIVETISVHQGFKVITDSIQLNSKRRLLWTLGGIAFFLSAVLDNLTTTVVMISLLDKLVKEREVKWYIGGAIVIAANAGGAWTPIGDVTTTMLWIGNQISTLLIMRDLFFPSLACMIVSFIPFHMQLTGKFTEESRTVETNKHVPHTSLIFFLGIALLIFVPIFKILTGLPPFMGMFFGVGLLWFVTDLIHSDHKARDYLLVPNILKEIDLASILFFLGILLSINSLDSSGVLPRLAQVFDTYIGNTTLIAVFIGLFSAIVDNVPLVAAAMGMYPLSQYPTDSQFWQLIAYCAGTGGSILIIGSAAGVVFMGMEKVNFFWYVRKISFPALLGYFAGIGVYLLQQMLFH